MDLSPEDLRVLALAREARTPDASDKARVAARLAIVLAASAGAVSTLGAAQAAGASSLPAAAVSGKSFATAALLKWWVGGATMLTAVIGGYLTLSSPHAGLQTTPRKSDVEQTVTRESAQDSPPVESAPLAPTADTKATAPTEDAPPRVVAPTASAHRRVAHHVQPDAAELSLLHRAQTAWRAGDAAGAHASLEEHRIHYPRSLLGLERTSLEVLVLCDLGERTAAQRLAREVLTRAPHSPQRTSIEQSCAFK